MATSISPLWVEQDLADSPWWAGNARLTNLSGKLKSLVCSLVNCFAVLFALTAFTNTQF